MRYVEITHTYVLPIPAEDVEVIEPLAREGMSIMEGFMMARAANIESIRSDWKLMPRTFEPPQPAQEGISMTPAKLPEFTDTPRERDRIEALRQIENDEDQGISLTRHVMGQSSGMPPHPWDQGIRITPLDHPAAMPETVALMQEGKLCAAVDEINDLICVGVKGHHPPHAWVGRRSEHGQVATRGEAGRSLEGDPRGLPGGSERGEESGPDGDSDS